MEVQRKVYTLDEMCRVLAVSESGYRAWKQGGTPDRTRLTDAQMLTWIRAIHEELKGAYGSPRMVRELRGRGVPAGKERVERLMREHGIRARDRRRYTVTTDSTHPLPVAPNRLDRDFTPSVFSDNYNCEACCLTTACYPSVGAKSWANPFALGVAGMSRLASAVCHSWIRRRSVRSCPSANVSGVRPGDDGRAPWLFDRAQPPASGGPEARPARKDHAGPPIPR